jgi:hypothetical protein
VACKRMGKKKQKMEFLGNVDDRCVIAPQYPVSWWTRLFWHVGFGLVRSVVDFVGCLVFSENMVFCVVENVVLIGSTVVMIHTHYPVNRRLVLVYLSVLISFMRFIGFRKSLLCLEFQSIACG